MRRFEKNRWWAIILVLCVSGGSLVLFADADAASRVQRSEAGAWGIGPIGGPAYGDPDGDVGSGGGYAGPPIWSSRLAGDGGTHLTVGDGGRRPIDWMLAHRIWMEFFRQFVTRR